jgi:hypothetical protein
VIAKRRLPELFPKVAGVLEYACVCVCVLEESTLKGINDEIGIQSFTELFDQAIQIEVV